MGKLNKGNSDSGSGFAGFLEKCLYYLLYIMPACLFLSYHPVIKLGESETMYFELSVAEIWLVVFDIVGLVFLIRRKMLFRDCGKWWAWMLLPIWITLSVAWSLNVPRGVLTVGLMWGVVFAGYVLCQLRAGFDARFRNLWLKWFFGATIGVCLWCMVQCVLNLAGVAQSATLLCDGCTYRMFGFPHPNGFAIEPQFMGNLLLAPAMMGAWLFARKQADKKSSLEHSRGVVSVTAKSDSARYSSAESSSVAVSKNTTGPRFLCSDFLPVWFFIVATTLFLTFSRGAIYAFIVGMMFLTGFEIAKVKKKERGKVFGRFGVVWGVVIGAFVVALGVQGLMAEVSPTTDTFATGVSKVINHLSLGVIDLGERGELAPGEALDGVVEKPVEKSDGKSAERGVVGVADEGKMNEVRDVDSKEDTGSEPSDGKEEAVFDGYVAESTDTRMRLTGAAIEIWRQNPKNMILGVGIGGAGQALYNNGLSPAPREIVQNEYASLLLETGVIGVLLAVILIIMFVKVALKNVMAGVILALVVAYGVSLVFFSGLPNALHVYLMPVVLILFKNKKFIF